MYIFVRTAWHLLLVEIYCAITALILAAVVLHINRQPVWSQVYVSVVAVVWEVWHADKAKV